MTLIFSQRATIGEWLSSGCYCWVVVLVVFALVMVLKNPRQFVQQVSRRIGVRTGAKAPKYGLVLAGSDGSENHVRIELPLARFDTQRLGLSLGRHPNLVDEVVEDETVSRRHLRIVVKGDKFYVEDLNSLNKTFLNGKYLKKPFKPTQLAYGAEVALGNLVLVASEPESSEVDDARGQANFSMYRIGHGSGDGHSDQRSFGLPCPR